LRTHLRAGLGRNLTPMPIDESLSALAAEIEEPRSWPRPICPTCDAGHIGFGSPEHLESGESEVARDHADVGWDPYWIYGTFLLRGRCENPNCKQVVQVGGKYRVDEAEKTASSNPRSHDELWARFYRVETIYPAPAIVRVPTNTPADIVRGLTRASRVLFADPGLAATALRSTVELFMTDQGQPAKTPKGSFRTLDDRITAWKEGDADRARTGGLLLAVKWLGNTGTHEDSDLRHEDVLGVAAILDEALHRTYTGPDLDAQAQQVIAEHGRGGSPSAI